MRSGNAEMFAFLSHILCKSNLIFTNICMVKFSQYRPHDKMVSLISHDYKLLQVLSRFGIPLGFHDKTIKEVCDQEGVDCNTFLTVVNFLVSESDTVQPIDALSIKSLLHYLKQSHVYFLDFCLPSIRRKLLDGITLKDSDVSFLILKMFDEYVEGVREHMEEEEKHLFNVAEAISTDKFICDEDFPVYSRHHEEVGLKLRELKNIILKYCPPHSNANLLNAALYDIYRCEEELGSHCKIEDMLLLPVLKSKKINNKG